MEKISWIAPSHIHAKKTNDWYWIVGIVTISAAVISIILNNTIFAIFIFVASFTLSLFASKKPESINVFIDSRGIGIGKIFYPYSSLESFWVETRDKYPRILIKSQKVFMPFIMVLIEDINPEEVRINLLKNLKEEEMSEPFLEKVMIYLGF